MHSGLAAQQRQGTFEESPPFLTCLPPAALNYDGAVLRGMAQGCYLEFTARDNLSAKQSASAAASRSPAIWVWYRRKIPVESAADWDTSVNRATPCYVFCW
jgi:hypothetical protein